MTTQALIALLADGEFHSGEELGSLLGVSRTAVWKQLKKLEDIGLNLESLKGKGYRLAGGLELLDSTVIQENLSPKSSELLREIFILDEVASTNSEAMSACQSEDASGSIWLAERQTGGRGRRGRDWQSPYGRNIYLSLLWDFQQGAASIEGLSLAVGVAVRRGLEQCAVQDIMFKWPNDLLHNNNKVGGILLEMTGDPAGFCQVVIGIGLNVGMTLNLGDTIDQPWADLSDIVPGLSRNQVAYQVINELLPLLEKFREQGFSEFRHEWEACDICKDKPVTISTINNQRDGIARGVTDSGALRFEIGGTLEEIAGGEVSLRAASYDT